MKSLHYERLVIAYHGCERKVRDEVLLGKSQLKASENHYDWLGHGIYFWEYGPSRAQEWAEKQAARKGASEPAVLGAMIHLGNCFDLLDLDFTRMLEDAWPDCEESWQGANFLIPQTTPRDSEDHDRLIRRLDCAMINWTVDSYEKAEETTIHSVRGVFQEGWPAFPGAGIMKKSHIQIAVRDPSCVVGYFLPV